MFHLKLGTGSLSKAISPVYNTCLQTNWEKSEKLEYTFWWVDESSKTFDFTYLRSLQWKHTKLKYCYEIIKIMYKIWAANKANFAHLFWMWDLRLSIGHVNVAFSLFSNINQSACSTLDWVLNNQSDFNWVLRMHHWEFSI